MIGNTARQEFLHSIHSIARSEPDTSGIALTVARMIAAARLWSAERDGIPGFLDKERELTKAEWLAILSQLAAKWSSDPKGAVNPFNEPREKALHVSGAIEQLRQLVIGCLFEGGSAMTLPPWLPQSILDISDQRHFSGHSIDPDLQDLLVDLVRGSTNKRVYCAYDGATAVALQLAVTGCDVTLDILAPELAALTSCLAVAADVHLSVRLGDPLHLARSELIGGVSTPNGWDASVVMPPFATRYTPDSNDALGTGLPVPITIEAAGVTLAIARGKKIALCVMPPSFLFRAAKADQIFKERAIRDYGLDSIIGLPRGKLGNTSIPVSVLVFKPGKPVDTHSSDVSSVFIVDAREAWESDGVYLEDPFPVAELIRNHEATEISVNVTVDDLAANGFNLSVERYVLDANALRLRELAANTLTVQLEDIVELYRPQAMPGAKTSTSATETVFAEVGVADIDEVGLARTASKQLIVGPDAELQGRKARLQPGDVLLVIKGSVGKVGFVRDIPGDAIWLASQSFTRLRLREHSLLKDPRVLFRFLSSDLGQANLQALRVGSAVPGLQMADVRRLSIVVPDNERQHEIARDVDGLFALQDEIQKLKSELADRQHQIWPQANNSDHAPGGKSRTKTAS